MGVMIPIYWRTMAKTIVAEEHNPSATTKLLSAITLQEASCPSDAGDGHPRTRSRARC